MASTAQEMLLNGRWLLSTKVAREYDSIVPVPGFQTPSTVLGTKPVWLLRRLKASEVSPSRPAILTLKGARFNPTVYLNGQLLQRLNYTDGPNTGGGMNQLQFWVPKEAWQLKDTSLGHVLEVKLEGLGQLSKQDASYIPVADQWRSNVGACLWDDVVLRFTGTYAIGRHYPVYDDSSHVLRVMLNLKKLESNGTKTHARLLLRDPASGRTVKLYYPLNPAADSGKQVSLMMALPKWVKKWSPDHPKRYLLSVVVRTAQGQILDSIGHWYGIKHVTTVNNSMAKSLIWNGERFRAKAISVVWHRWVRDAEGQELAYDAVWFQKNIMQRTKDIGGNTLRFHLGPPPERFLDWADSMGLAIQYEWLFFHGMPAAEHSLLSQWQQWLDMAARHPSVTFVHPWNETEPEELSRAWRVLNHLLPQYGPWVVAERDIIHIHKYWWGLFENLGLYYTDARQFPLPIMVDEFGGNYLDGEGNLGGYKTLVESYQRFLGRKHDAAQRLEHHTQANAKVAEYWRRIGAAGYSPFCALSSWADGNHWFMGPLKLGKPKPVWSALAPAYSPLAVSLDMWDRHYTPGQRVRVPVHLFNDRVFMAQAVWQVQIQDARNKTVFRADFNTLLPAKAHQVLPVQLNMPAMPGYYTVVAWLKNPPKTVKQPVKSSWKVKVHGLTLPSELTKALKQAAPNELKIWVHERDAELVLWCQSVGIPLAQEANAATIGIAGPGFWQWKAQKPAAALAVTDSIKKWIWLQAGPQDLGQGYPDSATALGPLQGVETVSKAKVSTWQLSPALKLKFTEVAEPESHLHADTHKVAKRQMVALQPWDLWLMNGTKGGLAIPKWEMQVLGLSPKAMISTWLARGADPLVLSSGKDYYAYELNGYYAFSTKAKDRDTEAKLRARVRFLLQDAPALKNELNPDGPINSWAIGAELKASTGGGTEKAQVTSILPLMTAGKGLTRTPTVLATTNSGQHIISQLMVDGRLVGTATPPYAKDKGRPDPVVQQLLLNWLGILAAAK